MIAIDIYMYRLLVVNDVFNKGSFKTSAQLEARTTRITSADMYEIDLVHHWEQSWSG